MPILMVIIDGMTDLPIESLGYRTPLEAAGCKHYQALKKHANFGFLQACPAGLSPDSLTCILTLLGVPRGKLPCGHRAYFEAIARGIPVGENDLVLRVNLVTLDQKGQLLSSCAESLPSKRQLELTERLKMTFVHEGYQFYPLGSYKNLMVLPHGAPEIKTLRTSLPHQNLGRPLDLLLPRGSAFARELASLSRRSRVGNALLFPWAGATMQHLPSFYPDGRRQAAVVTGTEVVRGLAMAMGFSVPEIPGATGDIDTNLTAKTEASLDLLRENDFVLLHINGADEASHRKNPKEKMEFLRQVDREVFRRLVGREDFTLLVTADHTTLSATGSHERFLQPLICRSATLCFPYGEVLRGRELFAFLTELRERG